MAPRMNALLVALAGLLHQAHAYVDGALVAKKESVGDQKDLNALSSLLYAGLLPMRSYEGLSLGNGWMGSVVPTNRIYRQPYGMGYRGYYRPQYGLGYYNRGYYNRGYYGRSYGLGYGGYNRGYYNRPWFMGYNRGYYGRPWGGYIGGGRGYYRPYGIGYGGSEYGMRYSGRGYYSGYRGYGMGYNRGYYSNGYYGRGSWGYGNRYGNRWGWGNMAHYGYPYYGRHNYRHWGDDY